MTWTMAVPSIARCPHVVVDGVLGVTGVKGLLNHVSATRGAFRPGGAWNRATGTARVDLNRRDCLVSNDLGPCRDQLAARILEIAPKALAALRIEDSAPGFLELELSSYGENGHFNIHIDTLEDVEHVRMLSCVYYFTADPRRFTGGALRLHSFPARQGDGEPETVEIAAETDRLIAFPSWLRHEVTPVRLSSGEWRDRRFAINAWLHRGTSPPGDARI